MLRPAVVILLLTISLFSISTAVVHAENDQFDMSLREGETRPTLDPAKFSNMTIKKAYQAAKDIPWVLDSIYCFCYCKESPAFRHKSLLSCYVDLHAAR